MNKIRPALYLLARSLGDVNAVQTPNSELLRLSTLDVIADHFVEIENLGGRTGEKLTPLDQRRYDPLLKDAVAGNWGTVEAGAAISKLADLGITKRESWVRCLRRLRGQRECEHLVVVMEQAVTWRYHLPTRLLCPILASPSAKAQRLNS